MGDKIASRTVWVTFPSTWLSIEMTDWCIYKIERQLRMHGYSVLNKINYKVQFSILIFLFKDSHHFSWQNLSTNVFLKKWLNRHRIPKSRFNSRNVNSFDRWLEHIRFQVLLQNGRNFDCFVCLLVSFKDTDKHSGYGACSSIHGMSIFNISIPIAIFYIQSPALIVCAIRSTGYFSEKLPPGHPGFDVIFTVCWLTQLERCHVQNLKMQSQILTEFCLNGAKFFEHFGAFILRFICRDWKYLHLGEFMNPANIFTYTETWRCK